MPNKTTGNNTMSQSNSDKNPRNNTPSCLLRETEFYHFYQADTPMRLLSAKEVAALTQTQPAQPLSADEIRFRQVVADIKKQLGRA